MNQFHLVSQQSPWLLVLCLLMGALYAFLLYQKKAPWSKTVNYALAFLRFVVVSILCWLLFLEPLIRQVINSEEKPTVVFALDNSQSIMNGTDSTSLYNLYGELDGIANQLKEDGINVDIELFEEGEPALSQIPFNYQSTNISSLLGVIRNNYENRNLDKVVLVSDGIHNQGISPSFLNYNFPIHTLALGDTTPQRDVRLQAVLANKVAYLGNKFPVVAEIENIGYKGQSVTAYLSKNGKIIDQKKISFKDNNGLEQVTFYATAQQKGIQHYVVTVSVLENEFTEQNNARDVYIEVIDGKEKILLVAASPHPDIKAIRAAVEKNENYSFDIHIPEINKVKDEKYDLVIFHQIPNIYRTGNELLNKYKNVSKWFILGAQSDLNTFNRINKNVKVVNRISRMDKVTPVFNNNFNKFTFESDKIGMIQKLPPVSVPFADYSISNSSEVLLYQRVGNIGTDRPLLVINQEGNIKDAILTGEGIWQWRLEEFSLADSHESFDELISKIVQYLSTKEDRRKLRVYPINNEFYDFEKVVFESEVYNDIYERVYDQKINLTITDEAGKTATYSFVSGQGSTRFEISGLKKGVYRYLATAQVQGKAESSGGEFTIKDLQLESLNNTADHNLLRQLAQKTDGRFYTPNQITALKSALLDNPKPNIIHSAENLSELINLKWIFFLLLALVAGEWVVRKYQGSY